MMKDNKYYQQVQQILMKYQQAERDYKPEKLREVQRTSLQQIDSLLKEYNRGLDELKSIRQGELRAARQKLDEAQRENSLFNIIKGGKIDYDQLQKQEQLQRYFTSQFSQISSEKDFDKAVEEIVATGDQTALAAFKAASATTTFPYLDADDNKYLKAVNRMGKKNSSNVALRKTDLVLAKLDKELLALTNPSAAQAQQEFETAQVNLQASMGLANDPVADSITKVRNEINGFGPDAAKYDPWFK